MRAARAEGQRPSPGKKSKGARLGPLFRLLTLPPDQFGISAGTMVTIDGKAHRMAIPTTWISTKGTIPR